MKKIMSRRLTRLMRGRNGVAVVPVSPVVVPPACSNEVYDIWLKNTMWCLNLCLHSAHLPPSILWHPYPILVFSSVQWPAMPSNSHLAASTLPFQHVASPLPIWFDRKWFFRMILFEFRMRNCTFAFNFACSGSSVFDLDLAARINISRSCSSCLFCSALSSSSKNLICPLTSFVTSYLGSIWMVKKATYWIPSNGAINVRNLPWLYQFDVQQSQPTSRQCSSIALGMHVIRVRLLRWTAPPVHAAS